MRRTCQRARGSTILELLLVIGILSVLLSIIVPALQAGRESARRISCVNNMRQISLALQNYQFQFGYFPPGVVNLTGPIHSRPEDLHIGWLAQILPFIEQGGVNSALDTRESAYDPVNRTAAITRISSLVCPTEPDPATAPGAPFTLGQSSYAACHHDSETPINVDQNGVMFLNSRVGFVDILDGTSMTIMIGEKIQEAGELGWISGTRSTLRNTGTPIATPARGVRLTSPDNDPEFLYVGGFGSYHAGGANFGFADGSVRFISKSVNPGVYRFLGNRADGELLEEGPW